MLTLHDQILVDDPPHKDAGNNVLRLYTKIAANEMPSDLKQPQLTNEIRSLLRDCWNRDPARRPSVKECIERLAAKVRKDAGLEVAFIWLSIPVRTKLRTQGRLARTQSRWTFLRSPLDRTPAFSRETCTPRVKVSRYHCDCHQDLVR